MLSHSFDPRRVKSPRTSTLALALKSVERDPGDKVGVA